MISPPFLLVSAELRALGVVHNAERSARLFDGLVNMGLEPVTLDYYQSGKPVESYAVPIDDKDIRYLSVLEAVYALYEQETALYVSPTGRAYLERPGKPREVMGRWVKIDPYAEDVTGYVADSEGGYWAVRP